MTNQPGNENNPMLDGGIIFRLQHDIEDVFDATGLQIPEKAPRGTVVFRGHLRLDDSEYVYDRIAERWARHQYTPALQWAGRGHELIELVASPGLITAKPSNPAINIVLFVITLISMVSIGALNEGVNLLENPLGIVRGLPFALSFLAILGAHEFGHYFMARYHKVDVTLPYFIPFPTIWGTMGAFIRLKSPTKTRKQLFDVGVAGPIAGLVVAVPVLFIGLYLSTLQPLPVDEPYLLEGNSIFYWLAKFLVFGEVLPSADGMDVFLHPLAWAGWSGLLVTVLNLFPVGQLDGGHVAYVLFGRYTRPVGIVVLVAMLIIGLIYWEGWLFWAILIFFLVGVGHPPPLNDIAPLDRRRQLIGYAMIVTFVLLFVPIPLQAVGI